MSFTYRHSVVYTPVPSNHRASQRGVSYHHEPEMTLWQAYIKCTMKLVNVKTALLTKLMRHDYLLGTAFQHLFIVLSICPSQVGAQALRGLIGQLDAVLQQTDGQRPLQQWRGLS